MDTNSAVVERKNDPIAVIAERMAKSGLVPEHLRGKSNDCYLVAEQASRWEAPALSVAQCTYIVHGKLGYEGKLVHAVINASKRLVAPLFFKWEGNGPERTCTVTGTLKSDGKERTLTIRQKDVKTTNSHWNTIPDMMLSYRATRDWARLNMPDLMLGIYTKDELEDQPLRGPDNARPVVDTDTLNKQYSDTPESDVVDAETVTSATSEGDDSTIIDPTSNDQDDSPSQLSHWEVNPDRSKNNRGYDWPDWLSRFETKSLDCTCRKDAEALQQANQKFIDYVKDKREDIYASADAIIKHLLEKEWTLFE